MMLFVLVTVCLVYGVTSQTLPKAVHEICTGNEDCPARATCRPTSCDGYTCLCDSEHVASDDRTRCMKASRIGDPCEDGATRCISEYATCVAGICECLTGFQATKDGRCKLPETNFIGEPCGNCEFPAQCVDGICKCAGEFRSLTTEEFWVDPISVLQCRPKEYGLDMCNGTSILLGPDVTSLDIMATIPPPAVLNANEWSLILPEKSIYEACNSHSQCPGNARCRPNSCDGFLCLCNVGFIASDDRLQCLPAVKTGETCDKRAESCLSPFAKCTTGICKCDTYFSPTNDGRCRIAKTRYTGETCRSSEECEYPGTCVAGFCACVNPQREITNEEFWIDPSLTIQCRPVDYNTWKCNGTIIDVPPQFHHDIPIDVEIEMTYKKGAHTGKPHEDHVEINPTIVVDDPKTDEDYLVPLHIAGILAAALFALLIACIFKTKRRKAIKRDISLTRTNILANKTLMAAEEEAVSNRHLQMEQTLPLPPNHALVHAQMAPMPHITHMTAPMTTPMTTPNGTLNTMTIPRPNVSIYNKHGWHDTLPLGYGDRSFYDNQTDIYPDSNTTTRSTGPFIVESPKHGGSQTIPHGHTMHGVGVGVVTPYTINRSGPYVIDGGHIPESYMGRSVVDGGGVGHQRMGSTYANETVEWRPECTSDHDPDLVLF